VGICKPFLVFFFFFSPPPPPPNSLPWIFPLNFKSYESRLRKETTRKERGRFLTILNIKRRKNGHGPLWSRPKYYAQISHTPKFSVLYKSGCNLSNTCVGKGFCINSAFQKGRPTVQRSCKCLWMPTFYDAFCMNEYPFNLTSRKETRTFSSTCLIS
jgi:hypothetical protein